jgi:tetratricopeptide (TPR) repeat protein
MNAEKNADVSALLEAARDHRKRGDRVAALTAFQAAAGLNTGDRAIDVAVAGELRALDRLDEAEALLRKILHDDPASFAALVERGHLARRRGHNAEALAAFEKAAEVEPRHLGVKVEVARSLRGLERVDDAATLLTDVLGTDTAFLPALIEQGHGRRRKGDHAGALASFEAALSADPSHAGIKLEIATALRALQRSPEAETVLHGLIETNSGHIPALISLGHLLVGTDRLDEATAIFRRAQAKEPSDPRAPAALAHIARLRDDRPAVLEHMRATVAADPRNIDARRSLAAELRAQGDLASARAELRAILDAQPDDAPSWLQLGLIQRTDHDRAKATEAFAMAHAKQPRAVEPLIELAREKWASGEPAVSTRMLGEALGLEPTHSGALALSAEHALLAGRPEEALAHARRAIESQPRQVGLRLLAARAAAAVPDRTEADRFVADARSAFGATPEILATQIHVLRSFHDLAGMRAVIAEAGDAVAKPALWIEAVSAAIAIGDFAAAEHGLATPPNNSRRDQARGFFLRGQMAAARRDYGAAIQNYRKALDLDGSDGSWEGELARACLLTLDIDAANVHLRKTVELGRAAMVARRESLNPSQHHLGQLLDEFALDGDVLSALRRAAQLPAREATEAIKSTLRANPDSTAAALMLLLGMRRAGEFRYAPKRFGRLILGRIPKRVAQFWDTDFIPPDVHELMESWHDPRHSFEHVVFSDTSATAYLATNAAPDVARAYRRAKHPAQRADLFRLAYLAQEGGFYADADDRRVASFDALAPKGATFVGYQEDYGTLANNFLAAVPDHPVIQRALKMAVAAVNRGDADSMWLSTGPGLLTRAFAQVVAESGAGTWLERAMIRELHEIQALVEIHCPTAYKRTDRHWSHAAKGGSAKAQRPKGQ